MGLLTTKLGTQIYHDKVHRNVKYKFVNNNKQPQASKLASDVCAYNLLIVGPPTMKLGTLIYFGGERNM